MSGRWKIKHPGDAPAGAARRETLLPPAQVTYDWVPRERNKHADRLANEALDAAARGEEWSEADSTAALARPGRGSRAAQPVVDEAEVEPAAGAPTGWSAGTSDLGAPTTLLLLRHGQTAHTAEKRFSGSGGEDPRAHGRRGGSRPRGSRRCWPLRAASTRWSARRCAGPGRRPTWSPGSSVCRVREVDDLRECAFGEWEGHTFAEVRERWPDELAPWLADTTVAPPGGESFDAVAARVQAAPATSCWPGTPAARSSSSPTSRRSRCWCATRWGRRCPRSTGWSSRRRR